ncbi:hypothetical protein [Paenibacillus agilis]|uniref:hypothetical protein n=1 Tax=Paenibacillus agilis TaxID=3020863 RepID=UPI001649DBB6|nr:hypothetical protein [Paenibacillus agilis]
MSKEKAKVENIVDTEVQTSELAAIVGKTPQWIRQLTRDGVLKKYGRGKYLLGESIQAYCEHVAGGKEEDEKPRLIDFKTALEKTKAEKAELELLRLKNELHVASDVEALLADLILTTKSRLLGVPSRIATECENETADVVEAIVRRDIEVALSSLAKYTPDKIGGEIGDGISKDN